MNKVESPQDAIFCTVRIDQTKQINENETLNLSANISEQNTESYYVSTNEWFIEIVTVEKILMKLQL